MKIKSVRVSQFLLLCALATTSLSAISKEKVVGGIIGCEVDMFQSNGQVFRDTILRLRNFNNNTSIKVIRIVSHIASGKVVYDTADGTKFPAAFSGTLTPNTGALLRFSLLVDSREIPGLNVAQVLFYWVPSNEQATIGLQVAAVKRIRSSLVNGNHTNHCHEVSNKKPTLPIPVGKPLPTGK